MFVVEMSSIGAEILFLMLPFNLVVMDLFGITGEPSAEAFARRVVNALDNDIFAESIDDLNKDIWRPLIASKSVRRWHSDYIGGVRLFDFAGFSQRVKVMDWFDWQMTQIFAAGAECAPKCLAWKVAAARLQCPVMVESDRFCIVAKSCLQCGPRVWGKIGKNICANVTFVQRDGNRRRE